MAPKTLHEGWSALTGIGAALGSTTPVAAPAPGVSAEALLPAPSPSQSTRSNDVPLLIQDPFNVLLSHFLLLPFNVNTFSLQPSPLTQAANPTECQRNNVNTFSLQP